MLIAVHHQRPQSDLLLLAESNDCLIDLDCRNRFGQKHDQKHATDATREFARAQVQPDPSNEYLP